MPAFSYIHCHKKFEILHIRTTETIQARGIVLGALVNNAGYVAFGEFKDTAALTTEEAIRMKTSMKNFSI